MDTAAFIPVKERSTRVPNKNFRDFNGHPLYEHFFRKIHPRNPFDEVYVNTDSKEVKDCAKKYGFSVIDRPNYLSKDDANGNDLLLYDSEQVKVDVYFQLFVTAPLLKPATIYKCHEELISQKDVDSVFTTEKHNSFFWRNNSPINYDPTELPRTQDLDPVYEETTGLYGITRESLLERECRIGYTPSRIEVSSIEAIDIDTKSDLELARLVHHNASTTDHKNEQNYHLLDKGY